MSCAGIGFGTGYHLWQGTKLARIADVINNQTEGSDMNEMKANDARARSHAWWKFGEVG